MEYSAIHPEIWTGETGARLHGDPSAQVLYAYLMTCRHRNQLGLYYLPMSYAVEDTGLSVTVVAEKLAKLASVGFCKYDSARKLIWVIKMAPKQISRSPKAIAGSAALLTKLPDSPLKRELVAMYGADLSTLHTVSIGYPGDADTVSIGDATLLPIQSNSEQSNSEQSKEECHAPDAAKAAKPRRSKPSAVVALEAALSAAMADRGETAPALSQSLATKAAKRVTDHAALVGVPIDEAARMLAASWARNGAGNAWKLCDVPFTVQGEQRAFSGPSRRPGMAPSPGTTHLDFADYPSVDEQLANAGVTND